MSDCALDVAVKRRLYAATTPASKSPVALGARAGAGSAPAFVSASSVSAASTAVGVPPGGSVANLASVSGVAASAGDVAVPVMTTANQPVTAINIDSGDLIAGGGKSSVSASYPLLTHMTVMLQSKDVVDYKLANGDDMCIATYKDDSSDTFAPLGGNRTSDGCVQTSMGVFQGYATARNGPAPVQGIGGQGFGSLGPCSQHLTSSAGFVNNALVVELQPGSAANTYAFHVLLTGQENFLDQYLSSSEQAFVNSDANVSYYLNITPQQVSIPLWSDGSATNRLYQLSANFLGVQTTPVDWVIAQTSTPGEYTLNCNGLYLQTFKWQTFSQYNADFGICNAQGTSNAVNSSSQPINGGQPAAWRFVVAESPATAPCITPTQAGCPAGANQTCLMSQTAAGEIMCPACCFTGACNTTGTTTPPQTATAPPGWTLCTQTPDPFQVSNTLQYTCGSLPLTPITDCIAGLNPCTRFSAADTGGMICRAYCDADPTACNAAKITACGVNQTAPASSALVAVLATPECSCINLAKSTAKYTGLEMDYSSFRQFTEANNATAINALNGKCWWPPCTTPTSSVLALTSSVALAGCPDNVTTCFTAIGKIQGANSKVFVDNANKCVSGTGTGGTSTSSASPGSNGSQPSTAGGGRPGNGSTSSAPPSKPFYKQSWFVPVCIVVGIVLLIIILAVAFSGRSSQPARTLPPAPTPAPLPYVASVAPQRTA